MAAVIVSIVPALIVSVLSLAVPIPVSPRLLMFTRVILCRGERV